MALVTLAGSPTANSLLTLAEAAEYIAASYSESDAAAWDALSADKQESCLVVGANVLAYLPFRGKRMYIGQTQVFPRDIEPTIPEVAKQAQVDITMQIVVRAEMVRPGVSSGLTSSSKINSVSLAGMISVSFDTEGDMSGSILEQLSRSLLLETFAGLQPYLSSMRGGVIGGSARYIPIPFEG